MSKESSSANRLKSPKSLRTADESLAARQFADALEQPWGDLFAAFIDTLLDGLAYGLFDRLLNFETSGCVGGWDRHGKQGRER